MTSKNKTTIFVLMFILLLAGLSTVIVHQVATIDRLETSKTSWDKQMLFDVCNSITIVDRLRINDTNAALEQAYASVNIHVSLLDRAIQDADDFVFRRNSIEALKRIAKRRDAYGIYLRESKAGQPIHEILDRWYSTNAPYGAKTQVDGKADAD